MGHLLKGLWKHEEESEMNVANKAVDLPASILWLLDAPLFIDGPQVDALYDASIRPDYEGGTLTLSESVSKETTIGGGVTVEAAIPWLTKGTAQLEADRKQGRSSGSERTLAVVTNPYRHLVLLALHYSQNLKDRTREVTYSVGNGGVTVEENPPTDNAWDSPEFIAQSPRALVLMDLPSETKLIPTAAEISKGTILPLFDDVSAALAKQSKSWAPDYPGSGPEYEVERKEYWRWFSDHFHDTTVMETVESQIREQRIEWIDFRMAIGEDGDPFLHLHILARGVYAAGTFTYNLIKRASKHGIRLVGTLKSEPDMNVLAIFDK